MMKILSQLEHKIGEKAYQFVCAPDSPLAEVKEALIKFMSYVSQIEDNAKAAQAQSEAEKPVDAVVEQEQPKQE